MNKPSASSDSPTTAQILQRPRWRAGTRKRGSCVQSPRTSPVFCSSAADAPTRSEDRACNKTHTIADRKVRVSLNPSNTALAKDRRSLPELALGAGFGITVLFGLSMHLFRSARAGQRAAELSNKK